MSDEILGKFQLYDLLGIIIPGFVAIGFFYAVTYWTGNTIPIPTMPDALQFAVFIAVAVVLGEANQALSSIVERFYFWTWRGKPSDRVLQGKTSRMSPAQALELKGRLKKHLFSNTNRNIEDNEIFLSAATICNYKSLGRVLQFSALYAYHRALTTLSLVFMLTTLVIILIVEPNPPAAWKILGFELIVTLLFWFRTKQRGMYYADEVLRMADSAVSLTPQ